MKWLVLIASIFISFLLSLIFFKQRNNVCKTFEDYYTNRDANPNCYYNPEVDLTIPEIIKNRGYPLELHEVTTNDNYILTVLRIKHGKHESKDNQKPVLFVHGLSTNCGSFVTKGNDSLGYSLADNGYDVWLGNFRGTIFSKHKQLETSDSAFWNFSLNELVNYDIKTMVDLVYNSTNKKLVFIGYSLSTALFLTYCSINTDHCLKKIQVNVALAPVFFVREWKSMINYIPRSVLMSVVDPVVTDSIFMTSSVSLRRNVCLPYPFQMKLCMIFFNILGGKSDKQMDPETIPISIVHDVDVTSFKVMHHLLQLYLGNDGQWYDYGHDKNLEMYGTTKPPSTSLANMQIPIYLISAKNDIVSTPLNVELLHKNLTNAVKYTHIIEDDDFSHYDFLRGKYAFSLVYEHVLKFLEKFP